MHIDIFIYLRFVFPRSMCVMRLRRSCIGPVVSLSVSVFMLLLLSRQRLSDNNVRVAFSGTRTVGKWLCQVFYTARMLGLPLVLCCSASRFGALNFLPYLCVLSTPPTALPFPSLRSLVFSHCLSGCLFHFLRFTCSATFHSNVFAGALLGQTVCVIRGISALLKCNIFYN